MTTSAPRVIAIIVRLSNGAVAEVFAGGSTLYKGHERPIPEAIQSELREAAAALKPVLAELAT